MDHHLISWHSRWLNWRRSVQGLNDHSALPKLIRRVYDEWSYERRIRRASKHWRRRSRLGRFQRLHASCFRLCISLLLPWHRPWLGYRLWWKRERHPQAYRGGYSPTRRGCRAPWWLHVPWRNGWSSRWKSPVGKRSQIRNNERWSFRQGNWNHWWIIWCCRYWRWFRPDWGRSS